MKHIFIFLIALLAIESHAVAGLETDIIQTNQAILPSWLWQPSKKNTRETLVAVQAFLEKRSSTNDWQASDVKKILQHTKEYRVQFKGTMRGFKKVIWCNFSQQMIMCLKEIGKKKKSR